jgi:glycosyltransferase involved in cell wall biosynthesis
MAHLYNSLDVLMNASSGEGFGVPIIEAQACGVPVLTHNATSMTELTFYGYSAKSNKKLKKNIINYGYRYMPSVEDMVKGLSKS